MPELSQSVHPIDYAPARKKPVWLTGRAAMLTILALAAAIAAWIVVPRVTLRARMLRSQDAIMGNRATLPAGAVVSDLSWMGSRPGITLFDDGVPELQDFTSWSLGRRLSRAAFVGGRSAGTLQRIVLVTADPVIYGESRPPELTLVVYVFEPGGWRSAPALVQQFVIGPTAMPVPPGSGWRLAILPGRADAGDRSRFHIELEAGYDGSGDERRLTITGFLMPDDTVRIDWPTEAVLTGEAKAALARAATQPLRQ